MFLLVAEVWSQSVPDGVGVRPPCRVIGARYFLDLSEAETAEALGLPKGTVKSRLSRALSRLREQLAGTNGEASRG